MSHVKAVGTTANHDESSQLSPQRIDRWNLNQFIGRTVIAGYPRHDAIIGTLRAPNAQERWLCRSEQIIVVEAQIRGRNGVVVTQRRLLRLEKLLRPAGRFETALAGVIYERNGAIWSTTAP